MVTVFRHLRTMAWVSELLKMAVRLSEPENLVWDIVWALQPY